ncbi:MAG: response regulator [Acidobacteria bacterium]|nr:response regulator [Acidobacteriota bacterium]MBI3661889.1 response regulator [Acidobacteriota bacterium]
MKHRILLVEDDAASRELVTDWLGLEGYGTRAAGDLATAQSALAQPSPDAVLLDVNLGNEDGLALAVWMRRQPGLARIPIIAVTAHAMPLTASAPSSRSAATTSPKRWISSCCTPASIAGWAGQAAS